MTPSPEVQVAFISPYLLWEDLKPGATEAYWGLQSALCSETPFWLPQVSSGKHEDQSLGYTNYLRWCFWSFAVQVHVPPSPGTIHVCLHKVFLEHHKWWTLIWWVNLGRSLDKLNSMQSPFLLGATVLQGVGFSSAPLGGQPALVLCRLYWSWVSLPNFYNSFNRHISLAH